MTGRTHALLGVASLWMLEPLPGAIAGEALAFLAAGAAFGGLLPDLDASASTAKYLKVGGTTPFVPVANALHGAFGHRGLLHSLRGLAWAALLLSPLLIFEWRLWLGLALGYASHLVGDACTKSGIPLLYPDRRRIHLLPKPLRLTTSSQAEDGVLAAAACFGLGLLLRHLPFASP